MAPGSERIGAGGLMGDQEDGAVTITNLTISDGSGIGGAQGITTQQDTTYNEFQGNQGAGAG